MSNKLDTIRLEIDGACASSLTFERISMGSACGDTVWVASSPMLQQCFADLCRYSLLAGQFLHADWPSLFSLPDSYNRPVESVALIDVLRIVKILNATFSEQLPQGLKIAIPPQALWKKVARQLSGQNRFFGEVWFRENSGGTTHEVVLPEAKHRVISTFFGNVWEMCLPDGLDVNTQISVGSYASTAMLCGGCWRSGIDACNEVGEDYQSFTVASPLSGFRLWLL